MKRGNNLEHWYSSLVKVLHERGRTFILLYKQAHPSCLLSRGNILSEAHKLGRLDSFLMGETVTISCVSTALFLE